MFRDREKPLSNPEVFRKDGFSNYDLTTKLVTSIDEAYLVLEDAQTKNPDLPQTLTKTADLLYHFHWGVAQQFKYFKNLKIPETRLFHDEKKRCQSFFSVPPYNQFFIRDGVLDYFSGMSRKKVYDFKNSFGEVLFVGNLPQYLRYLGLNESRHLTDWQTGKMSLNSKDTIDTNWIHLVAHDSRREEFAHLQNVAYQIKDLSSFSRQNVESLNNRLSQARRHILTSSY